MPKMKTHRGAAKRFRVTGKGKFMKRRAYRNHLLEHKSSRRKRRLANSAVVDRSEHDRIRRMLPYA